MTSKRAAVGIPVGVAAAVVVAIVATVLLRSGGAGKPAPLPLSLAGSGGTRAETAADAKMAGAPGGQGATYRFVGPIPGGLPEDADAYSLSDSPVDRDAVRRLAEVLGLKGEIKTEPDALVVRDGELVLRVSTTASRMWSYYREMANPCDSPVSSDPAVTTKDIARPECVSGGGAAGICLEGADSPCNDTPETVVEDSGSAEAAPPSEAELKSPDEAKAREAQAASSASSGSATASSPVMACPEPAPCPENAKCAAPAIACGEPFEEPKQLPLPDESVARALAKKVFDATGVGESTRIRAERGFDAWYISATIEIDGLEVVGFGHYVSVDSDGKIRDSSGSLATAEVLDRYPLVSAKAGLERLQKQQSGFQTREMCLPAPGTTSCGDVPPVELEVTDVRLGLLFSPVWENEKEKVFLVPAWVYDVKGRDYPEAVIAITDEFLQAVTPPVEPGLVDPGQPEPLVDPAQTEPGTKPGTDPAQPEPGVDSTEPVDEPEAPVESQRPEPTSS